MEKLDVYKKILNAKKTLLAALIDPDKFEDRVINKIIDAANNSQIDLIFVGGSLIQTSITATILAIKARTNVPVLIFPGSVLQVSNKADGILLISLISGRNPEYLIGNHVIAANFIKQSNIEVIPTGYMIVESGNMTSVEYISNTKPIPYNKYDIAISTAIAGELLGLKLIYLEAGSGAKNKINIKMISEVKKNIGIPLIVGGGINNKSDFIEAQNAGADIVVVGTAFEKEIYKF